MINLIPPQAQLQVQREYRIRVFSVWMFLLGSAFLIVVILNGPAYVLVNNQLDTLFQEYTDASDKSKQFADSEVAVAKANAVAGLLASSESVTAFSLIMQELDKETGAGVSIDDFQLHRTNGVIDTITISGEADSRLLLSQFRDRLSKKPLFANATLPLSNLAKDKDIPFTITVVAPSPKTP